MFSEEPIDKRTCLLEIDAKKHLILNSEKYKIPSEETNLTKQELSFYQEKLERLEGKK